MGKTWALSPTYDTLAKQKLKVTRFGDTEKLKADFGIC